MKYFTLWIWRSVLLLLPSLAVGQNLVPNPSFEFFNLCPIGISGIAYSSSYTYFPYVQDWTNPLNNSSPDYFHTCAVPASGVHAPEGTFGYQWPHGGNGYAGINAWQGTLTNGSWTSDYREYIQCKLTQPLKAGKRYCISFYISPTISQIFNYNYVAIDEVGVNFSINKISQASGTSLSLSYNVVSQPGNYLSDTLNWIKISGSFTASGGEEWMTMGCFNNSGTPPAFNLSYPIPANPNQSYRAYMYIDDVSLYMITPNDTTITIHDTAICNMNMLPMSLASPGIEGYMWNTGATAGSITANNLGTYYCVASGNCHTYIDSFYIRYVPDKKLNLGKVLINCQNQPVTLASNIIFDTYTWNTGGTSPTITVNQSGTYYLTATNKCGTQSDTVQVFIQPPTAAPIVKDTVVCQLAENVQLHVEGVNLTWYGLNNSIIGTPIQPLVITRDVSTVHFYVTQTIGKCESERVPVNVDIKYQPRHILDEKTIMCQDDIKMIGKNPSDDLSYKWNTGETGCCIKPHHEGLYRVLISSPYCSSYIDSMRVIFSLCDTCIGVPNAFTPNGDGRNDVFNVIVYCPVSEFYMYIYNRWGQKVFETTRPEEGWDGNVFGSMGENGIYVYEIGYHSVSTHLVKKLRGNIMLFR
jgi:gliding motility-associated-like protein